MIKRNFLLVIFFFSFWVNFAQKEDEFTLIKTPEQKELEAEEQDLKFQDNFFKALKERAQDNYDKAITVLDNCNLIYPDNVAVNFEYAKNYYDVKQFDNALIFVEKTLKQKPKETYVLEMAVKINKQLRNLDDAISYQKKLVQINPENKNTLVYLYILNKDKDNARKVYNELEKEQLLDNRKDYFKRILFQKPKQVVLNNTLSEENSISFEKEQFQKNKNFKNLKILLEKEKNLQKYKELIVDSSEGLSLFPAQAYVYFMNGFALNKQKRYKEALESLENGIDFLLDDNTKLKNDFYKQIAVAYQGMGKNKKATEYLNKIK